MRVVNKRSGEQGVYVGRPSALGNPFKISPEMSREEAIQNYRVWLHLCLVGRDAEVLAALRALNEDSVLVCWCAPMPCHAEVIARAWAWAKKEGLL